MKKFMSLNEVRELEQSTLFTCLLTHLDKELEIRAWAKEVETYLTKHISPILILDFHQVVFLNSSAIQFLIILRNKCQNMGIEFGLCGINGAPKKIFIKTRLFKLFKIGTTPRDIYEKLMGKVECDMLV